MTMSAEPERNQNQEPEQEQNSSSPFQKPQDQGGAPPSGFLLSLTPEEARALLRLLDDHLCFGWIGLEGEFDVAASGEVSPTLERLYYRVRSFFPRREKKDQKKNRRWR